MNRRGYIAGVTNSTFRNHPDWWDILCDIEDGSLTISSSCYVNLTTGMSAVSLLDSAKQDSPEDLIFVQEVICSIMY